MVFKLADSGYNNQFLRVNLTSNTIKIEEFKKSWIDEIIGGIGLATKIITEEVNPKADPLGEENKIVFAVGPLTGTGTYMTGRHVVATKSPLTNFWGQSDAGGFWGTNLKFAGYDAIVIEGVSDKPVYLNINNGSVKIEDATSLWGKDSFETEHILKKKHGTRCKVLSIGIAGENLVKFASIMNDLGRTAGRRGLGAVMGSKKLKAIVIQGSKKIEVHDKAKLKELNKKMLSILRSKNGIQFLSNGGTGRDLSFLLSVKDLPLKNWMQDDWPMENAKKISGITMKEKGYFIKQRACFSCPVACETVVKIDEGDFKAELQKGPEYETLAALGSMNLIDSVESLIKANELCNRFGIDTITTGSLIAAINELHEKGILRNIEELELGWNNPKAVLTLIEKIAKRDGFGNIIADGPKRIIKTLGEKAKECFTFVKNDAIPMHDPRTYIGMGLKYVISPYGPDHTRADAGFLFYGNPELGIPQLTDPTPYDVAKAVVVTENFSEVIETMIFCAFAFESWAGQLPPSFVPEFYYAVTGIEKTLDDLLKIGERIITLKRNFNLKIGIKREDETLPKRFREIPRYVNNTPKTINVDEFVDAYYSIRGWKKPY